MLYSPGAVSAPMLKSMGVEYVLCGHSERRSVFKDDDVVINRKVSHLLSHKKWLSGCIIYSPHHHSAMYRSTKCWIMA